MSKNKKQKTKHNRVSEAVLDGRSPKDSHPPRKRIVKKIAIGGVTVIVVAIASVVGSVIYYNNRVGPHVYAAGINLSGKTLPEAITAIQQSSGQITDKPVVVRVGDKSLTVHAGDIGLVVDSKSTSRTAYAIGRRDVLSDSLVEMARQAVTNYDVGLAFTYDQDKLNKAVADFASTVDQPEVNAGVKIDNGKVVETQGLVGHRLDQETVKKLVIDQWKTGQNTLLTLSLKDVQPAVKTGDTKEVLAQAETIRKVKFIIDVADQQISPKSSAIDSWISSEVYQGHIRLAMSATAIRDWLAKVAPGVNNNTSEPRLAMNNGVVSIVKPGSDGQTIDAEKTAVAISNAVRDYVANGKSDKTISVSAVMAVSHPVVTDQNLSSLGIVEMIGTATTSFAGSPDNRKHNIATGAAALNGIIIKPGDEFSTLRYLGQIDGASGYLPELVIKEDHTLPEFGGGLCQVSTTLFRASMNSGLPITERQNHSYRVAYYEPPVGMDATIYEGSPDFKFVNDTPSYILVQSHIDGTKITFDFYGKKDGRTSSESNPVVYNVTPPPDPINTNTDSLPTGVTKQTDHAHPGADASFTYTVLNSDGSVRNKQTFVSHYVPWAARFQVGTGPVPSQ